MKRAFPPFAAIRAFEASARHCSMQAAAEELLISASGVSHQVTALENYIGDALFDRGTNGLTLTHAGKEYLSELTYALETIHSATERVMRKGENNVLTVYMYTSLADLWFALILPDFRESFPEFSVKVVTEVNHSKVSTNDFDLSIVYDNCAEISNKTLLIIEKYTPCCSLTYCDENGLIESPSDILNHPLIFCSSEPDEWMIWFKQFDIELPPQGQWLEFDTRSGVLTAAREGLGVALGRTPYVDVATKRGRLIEPLKLRTETGFGYRLDIPKRSLHLKKVKQFSIWLRTYCRQKI